MGKVSIEVFKGNIRLRWRHEGQRYCLGMGMKDTAANRAIATLRVAEIERDLEYGMFDVSLAKYRGDRLGRSPIKVYELFEKFIDSKRGQVYQQSLQKYRGVLKNLKLYFKERNAAALTPADCQKFKEWLSDRLESITLKQYLTMAKSCWEWAIEHRILRDNPWKDVVKRVPRGVVKAPQPFSAQEIKEIIRGFRLHSEYSYYADFVEFLLSTGCRPGEAIALTWQDVSEDCSQLWIGKSYSRGSLKGTKPEKAGFVPLGKGLQQMLLRRRPFAPAPDALVFPTPRSKGYMDDGNFRNRAWKTVLEDLGIPYRKPYTTRSTLITYWLQQGEDPLVVAKFTRTSVRMIYEHYAGYIPNNARLPDILGDAFPLPNDSTGNRLLE